MISKSRGLRKEAARKLDFGNKITLTPVTYVFYILRGKKYSGTVVAFIKLEI